MVSISNSGLGAATSFVSPVSSSRPSAPVASSVKTETSKPVPSVEALQRLAQDAPEPDPHAQRGSIYDIIA